MWIEFDEGKRASTLRNHGLDMARAPDVLAGPTLTVADNRRNYGETRYITIGLLDEKMVVLVWTPRGKMLRIISLRKANDRERRIYKSRF